MPNYRYFSADILTSNVLTELPLYGVAFGRRLSAAGNFTGTFRLGTGRHVDSDLLFGTERGRTAVFCERDGTIIWGGPIWSRTYNSDGKSIQITAQTFESYFDRVVILNDFVKQNVDQLTIFKDLIDALQAQPQSDWNFVTTGINSPLSGVLRTVLIPGYEYQFAQQAVSQLVGVENGFDYMIDLVPSGVQDKPDRIVRVGYPQMGIGTTEATPTYDFPGNIARYWWPESGGGTRFAALGPGHGSAMLRAVSEATDLLTIHGYPALWVVNKYATVPTTQEIALKAAQMATQYRTPLVSPTFELKSDRLPGFDSWSSLGETFKVHIEDVRFPGGKDITSRMIGWDLQVADADSTELVKFMLDDLGAV